AYLRRWRGQRARAGGAAGGDQRHDARRAQRARELLRGRRSAAARADRRDERLPAHCGRLANDRASRLAGAGTAQRAAARGAAQVPALSPYAAPAWLPGGHLQTVYPSLFPPPRVPLERERWDTPDGDFIDVDFAGPRASTRLLV